MAERIGPDDSDRTILVTFAQIDGVRRLAVTNSAAADWGDKGSLENLIIASLINQLGGSEAASDGIARGRVVTF